MTSSPNSRPAMASPSLLQVTALTTMGWVWRTTAPAAARGTGARPTGAGRPRPRQTRLLRRTHDRILTRFVREPGRVEQLEERALVERDKVAGLEGRERDAARLDPQDSARLDRRVAATAAGELGVLSKAASKGDEPSSSCVRLRTGQPVASASAQDSSPVMSPPPAPQTTGYVHHRPRRQLRADRCDRRSRQDLAVTIADERRRRRLPPRTQRGPPATVDDRQRRGGTNGMTSSVLCSVPAVTAIPARRKAVT